MQTITGYHWISNTTGVRRKVRLEIHSDPGLQCMTSPAIVHCGLWHINTVSYVSQLCHILWYTPLPPSSELFSSIPNDIVTSIKVWVIMIVFYDKPIIYCYLYFILQWANQTAFKSQQFHVTAFYEGSPEVWWLIIEYMSKQNRFCFYMWILRKYKIVLLMYKLN